jgi:hypothetical protein
MLCGAAESSRDLDIRIRIDEVNPGWRGSFPAECDRGHPRVRFESTPRKDPGGFGLVYRARQCSKDRPAVLKLLHRHCLEN